MQIGVEVSRAVENKRIFVVEDDEIIRSALQFMLHDEIAARTPSAKVLMVADSVDDPVALACLKSGADGILAKPITIEAVRFKVDVLLGRRKLPMVPLSVLN